MEKAMYGIVISLVLLFPWALVALATVGHLRSRRVPFQLDARNVISVPYANGCDGAERQRRHNQLERYEQDSPSSIDAANPPTPAVDRHCPGCYHKSGRAYFKA